MGQQNSYLTVIVVHEMHIWIIIMMMMRYLVVMQRGNLLVNWCNDRTICRLFMNRDTDQSVITPNHDTCTYVRIY